MITTIIQARTGSARLPEKVLKMVEEKTFLEHMIERVRHAKQLDEIIIATTQKREDDAIAFLAENLGIKVFRGSEKDVLERYYKAALESSSDHIVRLTGDCPLLDPEVVNRVVDFYLKSLDHYDYVSNVNPRTYPHGMDVEVFSFGALAKSYKESKDLTEREHVTPYIRNNPGIFRIGNVVYDEDLSYLRLTLDYPEDLEVITNVFRELYPKNNFFGLEDILTLHRQKPDIFLANSRFRRPSQY